MSLFNDKRILAIGYVPNDLYLELKIIKTVFSFDPIDYDDYDIIVIGYDNQEFIEMQLQKAGKVRLEDYFYVQEVYKLTGKKKLCLMLGTCILLGIEKYLYKSKKFSSDYEILCPDIDLVEEYSLNYVYPDMLLANVDLFLFTRDSSSYRMSNETIFEKLNCNCIKLSVSGCIFSGYFPQSFLGRDKSNPYAFEDYEKKIFICEIMDKNINQQIEKGVSLEAILSQVCDENYYSHQYIENWFEKSFNFLKISEMLTDIKIYTFLKEHYKEEKLYRSAEHPKDKIIKNLCLQILEKLNCVDEYFMDSDFGDKNTGVPLYPSVRRYLNFDKKCENVSIYDRNLHKYKDCTFEEYVEEYYKLYLERRNSNA